MIFCYNIILKMQEVGLLITKNRFVNIKLENLSFVYVVVLKKTVCLYYSGDNGVVLESDLSSLSTDAAGQLDVLGHDGDALGVYCA